MPRSLSFALICVREIETPKYHIETLEFEGTLSELLDGLLNLFNLEKFDIIYAVENWQTSEFLDAIEKIREIDIEEMIDEGRYREVFGNLDFAEFRKYPPIREPTLQMEIKWSYLMDDQMVLPLLDLEGYKSNSLIIRCQKTTMEEAHKLDHGIEYPLDLLVIADATKMKTSRHKLFAFDIIVKSDTVVRSLEGTSFILPRKRELDVTIYVEELEEMNLKELYAYLAYIILQSKFLDELSVLFREECIEHTKKRYREIVSKWLRKV